MSAARTLNTGYASRPASSWADGITLLPPPAPAGRVLNTDQARGPESAAQTGTVCACGQRPGRPRPPTCSRPAPKPAQRFQALRILSKLGLLGLCVALLLRTAYFLAETPGFGLRLLPANGAAPANAEPLEVTPVLQNPALPNGCEAASLAALLRYQGFSVEPAEISDFYLPRQAYAGDPASKTDGWYCFEGPVIIAANAYLQAQGSPLRAQSLTGSTLTQLETELQAGRPVAVWFTQDYAPPRQSGSFTWTLPTGEIYHPLANLHCVVLVGLQNGVYTLIDPLQGRIQLDQAAFESVYTAMGSRAVVLR